MFGDSEFALVWDLRACLVTRDLLSRIERQLALFEDEFLGDNSGVERKYEISVVDGSGTETFDAANDIPLSGFPETTKTVRIGFEMRYPRTGRVSSDDRSVSVRLSFRGNAEGNKISVRLRGPLAREKAMGFCDRVDQLIEPLELENWFFRRKSWAPSLCVIALVISGLISLANIYDQLTAARTHLSTTEFWTWTAAACTAGGYLAIVELFYPACAFETSRWSDRQRWKNWVMEGFATLVVFETVVVALGKKALSAIGFHTE